MGGGMDIRTYGNSPLCLTGHRPFGVAAQKVEEIFMQTKAIKPGRKSFSSRKKSRERDKERKREREKKREGEREEVNSEVSTRSLRMPLFPNLSLSLTLSLGTPC